MNTDENDPLKFALSVETRAEYMRLPPSGQTDPIFGLKRTFLNSLVLPCKENGWRPPVKSILLRKKRARKGVRLIEIASLRAYIDEQARVQASAPVLENANAESIKE